MLNQLLKNIELPDHDKRAARSWQEIRHFSMPKQADVNPKKGCFLYKNRIFLRFEMLANGVFA